MYRPPLGRPLLFTVFTLSGFSGLIYESIWSHYLKLFLGHAAYAQTLVLAIFMGGMALGAWLIARASTRLNNLLLCYAAVEIATGLLALVFHDAYLALVGTVFDEFVPRIDGALGIHATKWLCAAALILPQSVLLGTTFPLVSGAVIRRFPTQPGATLSMLYFTNSLGAALGVLASGFWLIELVGLDGTVRIAGLINIALGAFVLWIAGPEAAPLPATAAAPAESSGLRVTPELRRKILFVAFLAGVASFIYEIAWIRMLSMVLGSSTHAFELMLSAFILGLAFGGLWVRKHADRFGDPVTAVAMMFAAMAVLAVLTLPAYGVTFDVISASLDIFDATERGYSAFNFVSHAVASAVMIPTTFVAGMTLPLLTRILFTAGGERVIGQVYASNTIGAIGGVMIAVHLLLPVVGLKLAIIAGALLQLGAAVLLAAPLGNPLAAPRRWATRETALGGAGLCVLLVAVFVTLDPMRMASGVYRDGSARLPEGTDVSFLRDGKTATISIARLGDTVAIATNGKPDAAINMGPRNVPQADEITMTLAAAIPLAMNPGARRIANIGIGSGLTSHVVLAAPHVEVLDSIEIEPAIVAAALHGFGPRVARMYTDPRSRIHYEDAKTFFAASKQPYDIIISEPSNPWISGVATLFSDQFYAQIRRHLRPNGLLVQWIQIYETDLSIVSSVAKALSPHFPDYQIFNTDDANILIVARVDGQLPELDAATLGAEPLTAELRRVGVNGPGDIEIRRIGGKRALEPLFASFDVPANSDFRPFVDLNAPRLRFLRRDALALVQLGRLPVAIAELTGTPLRHAATHSPNSARYFDRHDDAATALTIAAAADSGNFEALATSDAAHFLTLELEAARCDGDTPRRAWLQAVHALQARTTPYLPADARAPLWRRVGAAPCLARLAPAERAWIELLRAQLAGDPEHIARAGLALLAEPTSAMTPNQVVEAVLATGLSLCARGRPAEALELLNAYLPLVQQAGRYSLALRLLDAQILARLPEAKSVQK